MSFVAVTSPADRIFSGKSMMSQLCRKFDWSKTPMGPPETWSPSLQTATSLCLVCQLPLFLFCGDEHIVLYNDAYAPTFGKKHPSALGTPGEVAWAEIWPVIGPWVKSVYETGESCAYEDLCLILNRSGFPEETYHSFSYSAVGLESGTICAVLVSVAETTNKVIGKRRLQFRNELSRAFSSVESTQDVWQRSLNVCKSNKVDLPFVMLYAVNANGEACEEGKLSSKTVRLVGTTGGIDNEHVLCGCGEEGSEASRDDWWGFSRDWDRRDCKIVDIREFCDCTSAANHRTSLPMAEHWKDRVCTHAVVVPIFGPIVENPVGFFVSGVNPLRNFDEDYRDFILVMVEQIASAISAARALESERRRSEELANLDRAKTTFFSNVSHELRTPLSLMIGPLADVVQYSKEKMYDPEIKHRLSLIDRNCQRLLRMVNNLLDFARIEAGRSQSVFCPQDVCRLSLEISSLFDSLMRKGGLTFTFRASDAVLEDPVVYVDRSLWEKIVCNLLSNAFKFTLEGFVSMTLDVRIDAAGLKWLQVDIQDSGCGIREEDRLHVFERFYRIEGSDGRSFEGTGIGLALTQELVKLHGGYIDVDSELGRGSCFSVNIPYGNLHLPRDRIFENQSDNVVHSVHSSAGLGAVKEASLWIETENSSCRSSIDETMSVTDQGESLFLQDKYRMSSRSSSPELNTKSRSSFLSGLRHSRILVADDNADMRSYMQSVLQPFWAVETANDGIEAYEKLLSGGFDLLLSDVMMPRLDGYGLIDRVRSNEALQTTPIILLSARAGEEAKVEGLRLGADDYLVKTAFSAKELLARVRNHLELRHLRSALENEVEKRTKQLVQVNESLQREVEERIRAEKALAASEKRYRLLLAVSPVGLVHADTAGIPNYANPFTQALFEKTESEICAGFWIQSIHPDYQQTVAAAWVNYVQRVHEEFHFQPFHITYPIVKSSERLCWVFVQGIPEFHENTHESIGFILTVTDITDQKVAEDERLLASTKAEEEQRSRALEAELNRKKLQDFIDTLSHEVRNPLSGTILNLEQQSELADKLMVLHSEFSMSGVDTDLADQLSVVILELKETVLAIQLCSNHQRNIFNQVIELSALENSKVRLQISSFSLQAAIREAVSMHDAVSAKKSITLVPDVPVGDYFVESDIVRFKQVLINLISNAIKYNRIGGMVRVRLEVQSSSTEYPVTIRVQDSGPGFTNEEKSKLFDRFSQLSRSHGGMDVAVHENSSGLGLAISKGIVSLFGGAIDVHSVLGEGSTFVVALPWKVSAVSPGCRRPSANIAANLANSSPFPMATSHPSERILVVDDNLISQKALHRLLTRRGYVCEVANDGEEAVLQFEMFRPDVIFMDLEMPRLSGLEATEQIRRIEEERNLEPVRIFAISGYARDETQAEAVAAGCDGYLAKPFRPEDLQRVIHQGR
eukprot:ANDGO_04383.mRNA.1 Sensor histidine kinase TmoS